MILCILTLALFLGYVGWSLCRKYSARRKDRKLNTSARTSDRASVGEGDTELGRTKSGDKEEEEQNGEAVFHGEGTTQGVVMGTTCLEQCGKGLFMLVDTFL